MFGTVNPTPYDLNFSLFGIPVRVHPFFWLVSFLAARGRHDAKLMLCWVLCLFVSILVHELGHALTARYFGWPPHIVLHQFGGYASYQPTWGHSTAKKITISFAGPGFGFALYFLTSGIERLLDYKGVDLTLLQQVAFSDLEWINLWWGLVNLLPVYPLDGGQICRAAISHWRPRDGEDISLKLSMVTAIGVVVAVYHYVEPKQWFVILMFGYIAFLNFQELQGTRRWR